MIRYQIVVTNNGTAPATNIVINDSTPAYTTYTSSGPAAIAGQGSAMSVATVPADARGRPAGLQCRHAESRANPPPRPSA